jgi:RNA polymerase sigma-54 factor
MGIQQKLHTKLVQKLILTPSLQQAIKLLPMSTLELSDLLNQEMVENPMLEEVPTEELQPVEAAATQEKAATEGTSNKTDTWDDQDYEYFFGDYLDDGYKARAPQEIKELPPIENTLSTVSSLSDHLMWQLSMQTNDSVMKEIGSAIIRNLADDGYLVASSMSWRPWGPGRWRRWSGRCGWCRASILWAWRHAICRSACCCSCVISGSTARRPKRS